MPRIELTSTVAAKEAWMRECGALLKEGAQLEPAVVVALERLPSAKQREALCLHLAGNTDEQIGHALGIKRPAATRLRNRACDVMPGLLAQALREQLTNK